MKKPIMVLMYISLVLLLLIVSGSRAWASVSSDDFDPVNPAEPNAYFTVAVGSDHGWTSGGGTYRQGDVAYIHVSSYSEDYTFAYWTKDGVKYSEAEGFNYDVQENAKFCAVFTFTPRDPSEPVMANEYRLFLTAETDGSCSFNRTSGSKVEADGYVTVEAIPSPGYVFKGWFCGGQKLSESLAFSYYMPRRNVELSARFTYSPANPEEPNGDGSQSGNVDNSGKKGDVNGDGEVNTADAVMIINAYVSGKVDDLVKSVADVNGDGEVNTADAVMITNNYVNGDK